MASPLRLLPRVSRLVSLDLVFIDLYVFHCVSLEAVFALLQGSEHLAAANVMFGGSDDVKPFGKLGTSD